MSIVNVEASLTERYQTTVPTVVRKALGLAKRDKIQYVIQGDGTVLLTKFAPADSDPAISAFLTFLERDIIENPQALSALSAEDAERLFSLVAGVDVDIDAALDPADD